MKPSNLQESFDFMRAPRGEEPKPPFEPREAFRLAAQGIYLGTSSWKYRGWEGMIYRGGYENEAQFQRASLREYTAALPSVGVDFTYYAWPMKDMLAYLVDSTPENFRLCPKVTKRITLSHFPNLPAYGKWAGQPNPEYLDAKAFTEKFLAPLAVLQDRIGVVQFEFSGPEEGELERFAAFFRAVPRDFPYAIELRNPELVKPETYRLLRELELSPGFSCWTRMPPVSAQWASYLAAGGAEDKTPLVALGILRPGRTYEEAVQRFQPYQEVRDLYEEGRDDLAAVGLHAMEKGRKAYILVNNRLEGSAPHTLGKILERLLLRKVDLV